MNFFGLFDQKKLSSVSLDQIYKFNLLKHQFVEADLNATFKMILTDTIERTTPVTPEMERTLWDSCEQSYSSKGVISWIAWAMTKKTELFLVFRNQVVRKATREEEAQIKEDYRLRSSSDLGVYISFRDWDVIDILRLYSEFEYCLLGSMNAGLNLSTAVQVKVSDLRKSVSLVDSEIATSQAKGIATALGNGHDVLMDAADMIEMGRVDTGPVEKAMEFIQKRRSFYLRLPKSYLTGEQTGGIGTTGESDMRAVERGLKLYFNSIIYPVVLNLYGTETDFKSQDFREITSNLQVLRELDLVSEELMSQETKIELVCRVFDLDLETEKARLEAEQVLRDERAREFRLNNPTPPINGQVEDEEV